MFQLYFYGPTSKMLITKLFSSMKIKQFIIILRNMNK